MAIPEHDSTYTNRRTVYSSESSSSGWFIGIIVALALLAIGYLVFAANSGPATTSVDVNTPAPAVVNPAAEAPPPALDATPMTPAPAPAETAPATPAAPAPATGTPAVDAPAPAAPATPAPAGQ